MPGFTEQEKTYFKSHWLPVTAAQVDAINAALPKNVYVQAIDDDAGNLYIGSDLLTDMGPGGTYEKAAGIFKNIAAQVFNPKASPTLKPITVDKGKTIVAQGEIG